MNPVLLMDFGSTYTKVTAVDLDAEILLGTGAAYTTVETDISIGLENAIAKLEEKTGPLDFSQKFACSSAAGGLRMVTSGLVPELTAEAAKQASLGAGAKVVGVYAFQLTPEDLVEIEKQKPDIFLLVGGTDGGNSACILHNAKKLASTASSFPIVIAGNRSVAHQCQEILRDKETYLCENVMPKFGTLNIAPAQKQIRELFLKKIIQAKGLSHVTSLISGILMPTPSAVMKAITLLADGYEEELGIGELLAVDVGGATTDVYSVASGAPTRSNTVWKGLPEPYSKRTVEGDIGMRYSIQGIVQAAGIERISQISGIPVSRAEELIAYLSCHTDCVPGENPELQKLDFALAAMAIATAVTRHAGHVEEAYTMMGLTYLQTGKDLSQVKQMLVTGGSLIHTSHTAQIAAYGFYDPQNPMSLKPKEAQIWVDRSYILAAMGLLSETHPKTALRIMKKELRHDGNSE